MQALGARVRRPDPASLRVDATDRTLTSCGGLVDFGVFVRKIGLRSALRTEFSAMKPAMRVVYPMHEQLLLLMDAHVAGEGRVFGLESLAADPLFVHLAGGAVPSIDTLYDDLARFDAKHLARLESLMAKQALDELRRLRPTRIHLDIDTTVMTLFGSQQGALPGHNPRHHGRNSYHPMLARVAEIEGVIGAVLRPGDTSFGEADVPLLGTWIDRVRDAVGPQCHVVVRIDGAGDCTALLKMLEGRGVHYVTKADITQDLVGAVALHKRWITVDEDAEGRPTRQVAEIDFRRKVWTEEKQHVRVIAVRSRDRVNGKQVYLWEDLDYTVQVFLTNDWQSDADDIAKTYDARAGIEPIIGELKSAWSIGKAPSQLFDANHAAFLVKLLAYNVFRRFVAAEHPTLAAWRTPWARRAIILRPGRLSRSARVTTLHTAPINPPMLC
jgi:hypothetical protein